MFDKVILIIIFVDFNFVKLACDSIIVYIVYTFLFNYQFSIDF